MVTLYGPNGSSRPRNLPSSSVWTVRAKFVPVFVRVTVAPGTARPEGSLTTPSIAPVLAWDCANTSPAVKLEPARRMHSHSKRRSRITACLHFKVEDMVPETDEVQRPTGRRK